MGFSKLNRYLKNAFSQVNILSNQVSEESPLATTTRLRP
jgi:hypothetical protein